MNGPVTVVAAVPMDSVRLADVMARAFQDDPVSCWVFPDPEERLERQPGFFQVFVELAMASGQVDTTADRAGVALWLEVQSGQAGQDDGVEELFRDACGPYFERFAILDELMQANHPRDQAHWYLPFIAVDPERHGRGIGTALLRHRLAELDPLEVPVYLESSSSRNISLYQRLGFRQLHPPTYLPNGPAMRPMWREPGMMNEHDSQMTRSGHRGAESTISDTRPGFSA